MACISPILIKSPLTPDSHIYVPCGRCAWCRRLMQTDWYCRFLEERKENPVVSFLTLTYSPENLPLMCDDLTGEIKSVAQKTDIQKYIKRLRKENKTFKYFVVSEHGKKITKRVHYHALMFSKTHYDYQSQWTKGFSMQLPATEGAMRYVTKYILKGSERDTEIMLCSKKPAIGSSYLTSQMIDYQLQKDEPCYTHPGGAVSPLPRYYRKKIWNESTLPHYLETHKNTILETMESSIKHNTLIRRYKEKYGSDEGFYDWLNAHYERDLKIQHKINNS
ncbi:replication initiation protein [Tortoise microvirus 23]|nr:replication initiation protein [Tortoise microvirus 23]